MIELFQAASQTLEAMEDITSSRMALIADGKSAVVVFGRYCPLLGGSLAHTLRRTRPRRLAISGGTGKDSGPLPALGISEAHYLLSMADGYLEGRLMGGPIKILTDLTARDGVENAANMVRLLIEDGQNWDVVVLAHSTQLLRLALTFQRAVRDAGDRMGVSFWQPSGYVANPQRLLDQHEIFFEVVRMIELADEGKLSFPNLPGSVTANAQSCLTRVRQQLAEQGLEPPYSTAGLRSMEMS